MSSMNPTGLGESDVSGKRSLFRPPETAPKKGEKEPQKKHIRQKVKPVEGKVKRIRTTTELTPKALTAIQHIQQDYRLRTGKVLPLWKAISQAIENYEKSTSK